MGICSYKTPYVITSATPFACITSSQISPISSPSRSRRLKLEVMSAISAPELAVAEWSNWPKLNRSDGKWELCERVLRRSSVAFSWTSLTITGALMTCANSKSSLSSWSSNARFLLARTLGLTKTRAVLGSILRLLSEIAYIIKLVVPLTRFEECSKRPSPESSTWVLFTLTYHVLEALVPLCFNL